jgi:hypothetical protein
MKKFSILLGLMVMVISTTLNAQNTESRYKALFIYNFTRYIEWPSNGTQDFVIGILGKSTVYSELLTIADKKNVGSQTISLKKFNSASEVSQCSILFIGNDASSQVASITTSMQGKNTLIITERPGLINKGAGINFVLDDGKQRFELSKTNMAKTGLKVNTQLMEMAMVVD